MIKVIYSNENESISISEYDSYEELVNILSEKVECDSKDKDFEEKVNEIFPDKELYYIEWDGTPQLFDKIDLNDYTISEIWNFVKDFNDVIGDDSSSTLAVLYCFIEYSYLPDKYSIEDAYNNFIGEFDSDYEAGKYYIKEINGCPGSIFNMINDFTPNFFDKVARNYLEIYGDTYYFTEW